MKRKKIFYADQDEIDEVLKAKRGKRNVGVSVFLRKDAVIFDNPAPYYEIKIGKLVVPERPAEKDGE